jgi:hypothetical protein
MSIMYDGDDTYTEVWVGNWDSQGRSLEEKENRDQSSDRDHYEKNVGLSEGGGVGIENRDESDERMLEVLEGIRIPVDLEVLLYLSDRG